MALGYFIKTPINDFYLFIFKLKSVNCRFPIQLKI